MAEKDVLKKDNDSWLVQFTRNKGGVMINARGNDAKEAYTAFVEATGLFDGDIVDEGDVDVPFYDDGVEPYKKRDGTIGYKIELGKAPVRCPECKKEDINIHDGNWGKYFKCDDCGTIIKYKEKK